MKSGSRIKRHRAWSLVGEGNGTPLQCSCLENPGDGGTWWAAVCGVAQSRTRLKRLSSSSSSSWSLVKYDGLRSNAEYLLVLFKVRLHVLGSFYPEKVQVQMSGLVEGLKESMSLVSGSQKGIRVTQGLKAQIPDPHTQNF